MGILFFDSFSTLIVLSIAVLCLSLGLGLYLHQPKAYENKVFFIITLCMTTWMLCYHYIFRTGGDLQLSNILNSVAFATGFLALYYVFIFSLIYPLKSKFLDNQSRRRILTVAAYTFVVLSLLPPIAGSVVETPGGEAVFAHGVLELAYTLVLLMLILLIVVRYGRVIARTKGAERTQAVVIMLALVVCMFIGVLTIMILPRFTNSVVLFELFGPLAALIIGSFLAFALTRQGLFDIRPYVTKIIAFVLSVFGLVMVFLLGEWLVNRYWTQSIFSTAQLMYIALVCVTIAVLYQPVMRLTERAVGRVIYRIALDPQKFLNTINLILVNNYDLAAQLDKTAQAVRTNLGVLFCNFYLDTSVTVGFRVAGTDKTLFAKPSWGKLLRELDKLGKHVYVIDHDTTPARYKVLMEAQHVTLVLRLVSQQQNLGYLVVGKSRSGSRLTTQDIEMLDIIANEVAIAMQNALRFEEITKFNTTLQKKINEATAELQATNQKLVALDEAKDEFISMASHQLRTPLTSIKGYISMLLDGDAGPVNEAQRKFLDQAFVSSQRTVYLIADLLNVSRIKAGKFVIDATPASLPDMIEKETKQLQETAKSQDLIIEFERPKNFPILQLDENKTRQVIMNFVDNAIHYTPKGGRITITLHKTQRYAELTVTDTGIGVPAGEQAKLFERFFRASNAKKLRPDGTGLGLFMAKKIITAQGGDIVFKSSEGRGSTFGFRFSL